MKILKDSTAIHPDYRRVLQSRYYSSKFNAKFNHAPLLQVFDICHDDMYEVPSLAATER